MAHNKSSKQRHALRARRISNQLRRSPAFIMDLAVRVVDNRERADIAIRGLNLANYTLAYEGRRTGRRIPRYARELASTAGF